MSTKQPPAETPHSRVHCAARPHRRTLSAPHVCPYQTAVTAQLPNRLFAPCLALPRLPAPFCRRANPRVRSQSPSSAASPRTQRRAPRGRHCRHSTLGQYAGRDPRRGAPRGRGEGAARHVRGWGSGVGGGAPLERCSIKGLVGKCWFGRWRSRQLIRRAPSSYSGSETKGMGIGGREGKGARGSTLLGKGSLNARLGLQRVLLRYRAHTKVRQTSRAYE